MHLDRAGYVPQAQGDQRVVQRLDERGAERPELRLHRGLGRRGHLRHREESGGDGEDEHQDGAAGGVIELPSGDFAPPSASAEGDLS